MSDQLSGAILLVIVAVIVLRKMARFYGAPGEGRRTHQPATPGRARTRRKPPVDDYWSDAPRPRQPRPRRTPGRQPGDPFVMYAPAEVLARPVAPAVTPRRPRQTVESPVVSERDGMIAAFVKEHKF